MVPRLRRARLLVPLVVGVALAIPHRALGDDYSSETRAGATRSSASGTSSTLDTDDATTAAESLADIVEAAPSTDVRRAGGPGSPAYATIRGSDPWHVRAVLDGIPLHGAQDTAFDLSTLPPEMLGAITAHRSLVPAQLGAPAPGGVLELQTRFDDDGAFVWAGGGSFATRRAGAAVQRQLADHTLLVSGQYSGARNNYAFFDDRGTPLNQADDRQSERANAHVDAGALLARHRVRAGGWRLTSVGLATADTRGVPGLGSDQALETRLDRSRWFGAVSARRTAWPGRNADLELLFGGSVGWQRYRDPEDELGLGAQDEQSRSSLLMVGARPSWFAAEWLVLRGVIDVEHERYVPAPEDERGPSSARRTTLMPGAEAEVGVWDDRIELVAGSRLAIASTRATETVDADDNELHLSASPQVGLAVTPFVDRSWSATAFANAGSAERLPGFFELYGDRGATVGNPSLRAERRVGYDLGASLAAASDDLSGAVTWSFFDRRVDDLILFVQTGLGVATPQNVASAALRGHEVALHMSWRDHVAINATWSLIDAIDTTDERQGLRLPGRAIHTGHADVRAGVDAVSIAWSVDASGAFYLDQREQRPMPARIVHDVTIRVSPDLAWEPVLALAVHNVGDARVEDVALPDGGTTIDVPRAIADFVGQPLPGRAFYVTLTLRPARRDTSGREAVAVD